MAKVRMRDVFSPGFFANYLISLVLTCWIPIVHLRYFTEEGKLFSENYRPAYKLAIDLVQDPTNARTYSYLFLHLAIVFVISFIVWYVVLQAKSRGSAEAPQA